MKIGQFRIQLRAFQGKATKNSAEEYIQKRRKQLQDELRIDVIVLKVLVGTETEVHKERRKRYLRKDYKEISKNAEHI
jgi:CRISPR/Cas system-associated endoribonuclease Cas2